MEQGSAEWFAARCGVVTASRIKDVLAAIKGGEAAVRRNYRAQLVAERLTGAVEDSFCSFEMQRGIDLEPQARMAYEFDCGVDVEQVGFVVHPNIPLSGASPDGLIGDDGLVEIKCPKTATHIDYILAGVAPAGYLPQIYWQMACTGRAWCDFVSYDPRMPTNHQLFVVRIPRDDAWIDYAEAEVKRFLVEVEDTIASLALIDKRRAAIAAAVFA